MKQLRKAWHSTPRKLLPCLIGAVAFTFTAQIQAGDSYSKLHISEQTDEPVLEHIDQEDLNTLTMWNMLEAFTTAFDVGDELFEIPGNELDGIGANVGDGQRFAKHPRMDLNGPKQWANHMPPRVTGPNSQACTDCHIVPVPDGAGAISMNNVRDPHRTGKIGDFITRQPPHVFGIGAKQMLAEEMTADLHKIRDEAKAKAAYLGKPVTRKLVTKGVHFGKIKAYANGDLDTSMVRGINEDLILRPLQWKGVEPTIRSFVRGAENNELGLQATELVGVDVDGDYDGVKNELGVGDITALVIYQAGQPRPVTKVELADYGLMDLSKEERKQIRKGKKLFKEVMCDSCHRPTMYLKNSVFSEPSMNATHRDKKFPSGDYPEDHGLKVEYAIKFDITTDMPDNIIELADGSEVHLGNFEKDEKGRTMVHIFSDLKRHDLGMEVAESVDEEHTGKSVFITQPLWGAGSTPPYMHDGRSPTITDAIMHHGGEAKKSRKKFKQLSAEHKKALVAYVMNNILLLVEEEEDGGDAGDPPPLED